MAFGNRTGVAGGFLAVCCTAGMLLIGDGMEPLWPVMWVAFIPILLFVVATHSWRLAGGAAACSVLVGSLTMLRYLHFVLGAPVVAWLVPFSVESVVFAAGAVLYRGLLRRGFVASAVVGFPAFWSSWEYLESLIPPHGTAGSLAYTQQGCLPILQLAAITGPWGITFLLLLFPSAAVAAIYVRSLGARDAGRVGVPVVLLIAAVASFGAMRLAGSKAEQKIRVGLLDTDSVTFAQQRSSMQALIGRYAEGAEKLAREGAKVVVMPEKIGLLRESDTEQADRVLQGVADRTGATLVIGVVRPAGPDSFNEARIYRRDRAVVTYDKQHMLPPFESNLKPGTSLTLLETGSAPIGVAICKDMDFIRPALEYGRAGIGLLLDPAWDFNIDRTWHGHIAIMRGVEGGYAIAHAAKDGFLTVTDDRGRILAETRTDGRDPASLVVDVPLEHEETFFDKHGVWFPYLTVVLLLGAVARLAVGWRAASPILGA